MSIKIMGTLELLEEKIENIKWLVSRPSYFKRAGTSKNVKIIRKSAGILSKLFPKGTSYENKMRKEWESSFRERAR